MVIFTVHDVWFMAMHIEKKTYFKLTLNLQSPLSAFSMCRQTITDYNRLDQELKC